MPVFYPPFRNFFAKATVCLLLAGLVPSGVWAQAGRGTLPPPEVQRIFRELNDVPMQVAAGEYEEALRILNRAIPLLRERSEEDPSMMIRLGAALYIKGVCHVELQQYAEAQNTFREFIQRFPTNPNVIRARLLAGESQLYLSNWTDVIALVRPVVEARGVPYAEISHAHQLLGEAYFQLEMWEQALPHLRWLYQNGPDQRLRNAAAAQFSIALVRLQRFEDLYRIMPFIHRTDAKYDITMNLLLLEEGDRFLRDRRQDMALLLYRMVVPYSLLKHNAVTRRAALEREMASLRTMAAAGIQDTRRVRQIERMIQEIDETLADLENYPDYDLELRTRLGDVYYGLHRYEEAIQLYLSIYTLNPESELAERAMYSAYMSAFNMQDMYRAIEIAHQYIQAYPGGEFWDDVTMHAAGLLLSLERWFETVEMVEIGLQGNPDHSGGDHMLYFKGYAHFQMSQLPESMAAFARLKRQHPQSTLIIHAEYWHALGHLFLQQYAEAREEFDHIVQNRPGGPLREDAFYRRGVAEYGLGDFQTAERTFLAFLNEYPDSILASEAHAMIGDILASWGQLDEAMEAYRRAVDTGVNMVQVDYATFQQARTLELEAKWEEIIALFEEYETRFADGLPATTEGQPTEINYTESAYWRGNAWQRLGEKQKSLEIFYDTLARHGNAVRAYGLDFILRDLEIELSQIAPDSELGLDMRQRLNDELDRAVRENLETLALRLETLQFLTTNNETLKANLLERLLDPELIPLAPPFTLEVMGRLGVEHEKPEFVSAVYEHFLQEFEDSDMVLDALVGLAQNRFEEERFGEAADLLRAITDRYPTLPQAAEAYLRLGQIYRIQEEFDLSIEVLSLILSVQEWRGELWPRALIEIGHTHAAAGRFSEAFTFFQRVYVMYTGFPRYAAEAYYQSARMLVEGGQISEARNTLREMLDNPVLAAQPAATQARAFLTRLP